MNRCVFTFLKFTMFVLKYTRNPKSEFSGGFLVQIWTRPKTATVRKLSVSNTLNECV